MKSVAVICTTTDSIVNGWRAITLLGLDGQYQHQQQTSNAPIGNRLKEEWNLICKLNEVVTM